MRSKKLIPKEIQWMPWGKEAFNKARREKKPVFLDIFGVWCHYCHLMDENYKDPKIIEKVNKDFIPVKVDTDKMPDVNLRYNQGGWPSIVFLDSEGEIMAGSTFMPGDDLLLGLDRVEKLYKQKLNRHAEIERKEKITLNSIEDIEKGFLDTYDSIYGGFGAQAKFPDTTVLELLLLSYKARNKDLYLNIVKKTLSGIIGGLYDPAGGGFFRYSTTRDWKKPHYEKILETNANMVSILSKFLEIAREKLESEVFSNALYKTVNYLLFTLTSPRGGFYGSQDADGEEKYYDLQLQERVGLPRPFIDRTIFCDLNGYAINAFIDYIEFLQAPKLSRGELDRKLVLGSVQKAAEFIMKNCWSPEFGVAHYFEDFGGKGKAVFSGLLLDNVALGYALTRLSKYFPKKIYLREAVMISDFLLKNFLKRNGAFADKLVKVDDVGLLKFQYQLIEQNSKAALFYLDLAVATKDKKYRRISRKILEVFHSAYKQDVRLAATYGLAVAKFLGKTL